MKAVANSPRISALAVAVGVAAAGCASAWCVAAAPRADAWANPAAREPAAWQTGRSDAPRPIVAQGAAAQTESQAYLPLILRKHALPSGFASPTPTRPAATTTSTPAAGPTAGPSPTVKPPPEARLYEEDDPAIVLAGAWSQVSDESASSGSYAVAEAEGASLTLAFDGSHIALYRRVDTDGGRATVSIDGRSHGQLEFYFPERRWQVPAVYDHLGDGSHELKLTVARQKHASSTGTKAYVDVIAVPSPFEASPDQIENLDRANMYRDLAGLPRMSSHRALDLAAQNHADYSAAHSEGHGETFGQSGFTGARPGDRCRYTGYAFTSFEVMAFAGGSRATPGWGVDMWIGSVYHRLPFMSYRSTQVGAGVSGTSIRTVVMDFGTFGGGSPAERLLAKYPADGQTGVPASWYGAESPDPLPDANWPVGYPVSLHIAQPAASATGLDAVWRRLGRLRTSTSPSRWSLGSATITDASGADVAAYVLDKATDPNKMLGDDVVFVIPKQPLTAGSTYSVRVAGLDSRDVPFDEQWAFTTGTGVRLAASVR